MRWTALVLMAWFTACGGDESRVGGDGDAAPADTANPDSAPADTAPDSASDTGLDDVGESAPPDTGDTADTLPDTPDTIDDVDSGDADSTAPRSLRIIAFNDFHGALQPSSDAPGAAAFAAAVAEERSRDSVLVAAGDLIGGSPLLSALFHDEPTIEVMNAIGVDYLGLGNHELDEGSAELLRMRDGGCHPLAGCAPDDTFGGASFEILAANVSYRADGAPFLPAYAVRELAGIDVAFVGMTLEATPGVTVAAGITDLAFADEVETMNALVPELEAAGVELIVLLLHQGGRQLGDANDCLGLSGAIIDIAAALDPAVRIVLSGHSHGAYICAEGDRLVSSAGAQGRLLTVIDVSFDPLSGAVLGIEARNRPVAGTPPDPAIAALVADFDAVVAPRRDAVVATISDNLWRGVNPAGEAPLGSVITDGMLFATQAPAAAAAEVALFNSGGIRASLEFEATGTESEDGQVTFGEAFAVQPFSNLVSTVDLSGRDLRAALEHWVGIGKPLQVAGIVYTWDSAAPVAKQVIEVLIGGAALDPERSYRVTVNEIVEDTLGLDDTTEITGAGVDLDLLIAYLAASSPLAPPTEPRIIRRGE